MPNYTYFCEKCNSSFELFSYIKDYNPNPNCLLCSQYKTYRLYSVDIATQSTSIRKSDSELKTLGDLAMRNTERMSDDQKTDLYMKHNSYKEDIKEAKPLPSGMNRIEKKPKTLWPGTSQNKKRRFKK
jgi:putative FmdB family regulatory protein